MLIILFIANCAFLLISSSATEKRSSSLVDCDLRNNCILNYTSICDEKQCFNFNLDNSDENTISPMFSNCLEFAFRCSEEICISTTDICNGITDCENGSDENEYACLLWDELRNYNSDALIGQNDEKSNIPNIRVKRSSRSFKTTSAITNKICRMPLLSENHKYSISSCDADPSGKICSTKPGDYIEEYSIITIKCNEGYYNPEGKNEFTKLCLAGEWIPSSGRCVRKSKTHKCQLPIKLENQLYYLDNCLEDPSGSTCGIKEGGYVGKYSSLRLVCKDNFYFPNKRKFIDTICLDGKWRPEIVNCSSQVKISDSGKTCKFPNSLSNYTYTVVQCANNAKNCTAVPTSAQDRTLMNFKCAPGFENVADDKTEITTLCTNGEWAPPIIQCLPSIKKKCTLPPQTGDQVYIIDNCDKSTANPLCAAKPGDEVDVSVVIRSNCAENFYRPSGQSEQSLTCTDSGWSSQFPACLPVTTEAKPTPKRLVQPNDRWCLNCLCEFKTNCNRSVECINYVCGMFQMTNVYWIDAQRPTVNNEDPESDDAFVHCALDPHCAEITVANYMEKFAQDCNDDGVIDCFDYAMLHQFGGYSCNLHRSLEKNTLTVLGDCVKRARKEQQSIIR